LPHFNIQIETLVNVRDGIMNVLLNLCIWQSGDVDLAYLGKIYRTAAVHGKLGVEVNLPPDANHQLITGSEHVVWSDIHFP
jgi:hypothetical protein